MSGVAISNPALRMSQQVLVKCLSPLVLNQIKRLSRHDGDRFSPSLPCPSLVDADVSAQGRNSPISVIEPSR